jgi:hypothetical protein
VVCAGSRRGEQHSVVSERTKQKEEKRRRKEKQYTYIEGERETVHSRKCARARVFTFSSPFVVVPLLFDVTQDETRNSSCLYTSSPSPYSFSSSSFQKKPNRQRSRRALKSVNDRKKKRKKERRDSTKDLNGRNENLWSFFFYLIVFFPFNCAYSLLRIHKPTLVRASTKAELKITQGRRRRKNLTNFFRMTFHPSKLTRLSGHRDTFPPYDNVQQH